MTEITDCTVSSGDIMLDLPTDITTVSSGDLLAETLQSETEYIELLEKVDKTNYLLTALLFFLIFQWAEEKSRVGVRRIFKHE